MNKILVLSVWLLFGFTRVFSQCSCSGTSISITNGSLNGTPANMNNSNKPTGWSAFSGTGSGLGTSSNTIDCASILSSSCNGGAFARIISNGTTYNEGITQTVSGLTIGDIYEVTFSQALVTHWSRSTGYFNITFCGSTISGPSLPLPISVPAQTSWSTVTVGPFTATATSHSLSFLGQSNRDGNLLLGASLPLGSCTFGHSLEFTDLLLDGISICRITALPIELIDFKAEVYEVKSILLNWQTASEINNDYFTVEKSKNGHDWEELIQIDGAGNSSTLLEYSTFDNNPYFGISYYRLKQTDFNGQFEYSQVRGVNIERLENSQIEIYPNPSNNKITINGSFKELREIVIYNTLGQNVTTLTRQVITNKNQVVIDISKLNKGMYYIKTKNTANKVYKQ